MTLNSRYARSDGRATQISSMTRPMPICQPSISRGKVTVKKWLTLKYRRNPASAPTWMGLRNALWTVGVSSSMSISLAPSFSIGAGTAPVAAPKH